jgi:hypothetical protein
LGVADEDGDDVVGKVGDQRGMGDVLERSLHITVSYRFESL